MVKKEIRRSIWDLIASTISSEKFIQEELIHTNHHNQLLLKVALNKQRKKAEIKKQKHNQVIMDGTGTSSIRHTKQKD
ncbi:MAG: hypothetical protein EZS28_041663 [Streblomastix strix]|uniref:Uncharacterized protein n=1 Tax=Streblomastix strix TaxID=222440 RepID=A0A5J4TXL0_9EUKA|nr:MAG: hypothetical protein EZS28_041663 [Streblomastix strix]